MGTFSGGARAAGVSGDIDYALSSSYLHTDGYPTAIGGRRDVGSDNVGASAKATWTPTTSFKLTAVGRYSYTDADTNDGDNDPTSPTFGQIIDSPGARSRNQAFYGLLRGQLDLLDGRFTNVVSGQIADTTRVGFDVPDAYSPRAGQPIVKTSGDHGRRVKASDEGTFRFGSDTVKQSLTGAIDYERESERSTVALSGAYQGWRHTTNTGVVGEYELIANDRLGLGASVRHDFNTRFRDDTTYRVQGSYRFDEGTRIHAATGSGIKAPEFGELFDYSVGRYIGNPNLRPEKSTGYEAGVEQALTGGRIVLGATYFDNRLRHEIVFAYGADGLSSVNEAGRTHQRGVEMYANAKLGGGWRLDASYTYLHAPRDQTVLPLVAPYTGTPVTAQAVRRASSIASASLNWAPEDRPFSANVTVRYNGRQNDLAYIDPSYVPALARLRSFTLLNLAATYRLTEHLELFGRVENLLDRDYVEVYSFATPGRAAYGGGRVRF